MHGGSATLVQSIPVRETFEGKTVWEGVVHVFDPAGHPTATRAYAWSSPIEGSTKRRFFAVLLSHQSKARKLRCARRSWRNRGGGSEQQINRRPAYDDLSTRSGGGGSRCSPGGSYPGA